MRALTEGLDVDVFFSAVRTANSAALMLDYDGTLAPFVVERDKAFPYPGVRERVESILADTKTRLVVISGRAAADIPGLLGTSRQPEIWGSHGWERVMSDGSRSMTNLGEKESTAINRAAEWAVELGHPDRLEVKPAGAAFHLRGLGPSESAALHDEAIKQLGSLSAGTELELHEFDGGIEMRVMGRDKGDAVDTLMAELTPGSPVAFLGDDITDEDAFGAIEGRGLGVLVRPELRDTRAGLWIVPPDELLWFLDRWLDATRGGK